MLGFFDVLTDFVPCQEGHLPGLLFLDDRR